MNDSSSAITIYTILYTADKQKKFKKWHDGTIRRYSSDGGKTIFKLFGSRPCDIDDDPWDYEAGREKKGYRVAPFLETLKVSELEVGQQIQTAKHLITIESLLDEDDSDLGDLPVKRMKTSITSLPGNGHRPASIDESECVQHENYAILYRPNNASKEKAWLDGSLKYDHANNRAYFYTAQNKLLLQKEMEMEEVKEGVVFESAWNVIHICEHLDTPVNKSNTDDDMVGQWYEVIYTSDKVKKAKKWIDGYLEWNDDKLGKFWTLDKKMLLHKQRLTEVNQGQQVVTGRHIFEIGCAVVRVPLESKDAATPSKDNTLKSKRMLPTLVRKESSVRTIKPDLIQDESSQQSDDSILQPRSLTMLTSLLPNASK